MNTDLPSQTIEAPRVLIVKRSSLGDVVLALPVACALRDRYPDAHIAWVVESRFADVVLGHPALDEVILVNRQYLGKPLELIREWWRMRGELRRRRFDWTIDLQGLFKSAMLLPCSGAARRIGRAEHRRELSYLLYNERSPLQPENLHAVNRYLEVAEYLGCDISRPRFDLPVQPGSLEWADAVIRDAAMPPDRPLVGLNAGTSHARKCWPPERFVEVANAVGDVNWVVLGGPDEKDLAYGIADQIRGPNVVTAGRTDLPKLVAMLSRLDAVISGDTGPMHISAALGVPVVALFGPTNPATNGPFGPRHRVLAPRAAAEAGKPRPSRGPTSSRAWFEPDDRDWMLDIEVPEVIAALTEVLGR